jgi:hypothetical protein
VVMRNRLLSNTSAWLMASRIPRGLPFTAASQTQRRIADRRWPFRPPGARRADDGRAAIVRFRTNDFDVTLGI